MPGVAIELLLVLLLFCHAAWGQELIAARNKNTRKKKKGNGGGARQKPVEEWYVRCGQSGAIAIMNEIIPCVYYISSSQRIALLLTATELPFRF